MKTALRWIAAVAIPVLLAVFLFWARGTHVGAAAGRPGVFTRHVDGSTFTLASTVGQPLVLNFWATWCHPCIAEIPTLARMADELEPRGVRFLAVDQDSRDGARDAVEEFFLQHPSSLLARVVYADDVVLNQFEVAGLPTTYVLDRQGRVLDRTVGPVDPRQLRASIDRALESAR